MLLIQKLLPSCKLFRSFRHAQRHIYINVKTSWFLWKIESLIETKRKMQREDKEMFDFTVNRSIIWLDPAKIEHVTESRSKSRCWPNKYTSLLLKFLPLIEYQLNKHLQMNLLSTEMISLAAWNYSTDYPYQNGSYIYTLVGLGNGAMMI